MLLLRGWLRGCLVEWLAAHWLAPPPTDVPGIAAASRRTDKTLGRLFDRAALSKLPPRSAGVAARSGGLYGPEIPVAAAHSDPHLAGGGGGGGGGFAGTTGGSAFWESMSSYYEDKSTAYEERRCSTSLRVDTPNKPMRPLSRSMQTLRANDRLGALGAQGRLRTPDQLRRRSTLSPSPRRSRFQDEAMNDLGQEWRFMVRRMPARVPPDAMREPVLVRQ